MIIIVRDWVRNRVRDIIVRDWVRDRVRVDYHSERLGQGQGER